VHHGLYLRSVDPDRDVNLENGFMKYIFTFINRCHVKTVLIVCILILFECKQKEPELTRPNILFFLVDDLGWKDLGCYGSSFYETPNIDAFAANSLVFTNAYAPAPVCSPSRASILTGKAPARLHLTDWTGPAKWHSYGKLKTPDFAQHMDLEEITMAEAFKAQGYSTCFLGKWHVGSGAYYPQHQGFDVTIGVSEAGGPPSFFHPYYNKGYEGTEWPPQIEDLAETGKEGEYLTDRLTDEALGYLDEVEPPFLLYFSHFAVHRPHQAKEDMINKYQAKADALPVSDSSTHYTQERESIVKTRQDFPVFAAMVESVDQSFGRLVKKLEDKGMLENTIVVFTSDNGGLSAMQRRDIKLSTSVLPLRAGKGWLYEGGIRVPMIIGWKDVIQAGRRSSFSVSGTDMYPTLLDMAGLDQKPEQHLDALNLTSLILHEEEPEREAMFFHYPHYHPSGQSPASAVISGNYKLIRWYEDETIEFYNIEEDIGEQENLAEIMPDLKQKLLSRLENWLDEVNAQRNE
jgi:arylsulfatase A-like enzyme